MRFQVFHGKTMIGEKATLEDAVYATLEYLQRPVRLPLQITDLAGRTYFDDAVAELASSMPAWAAPTSDDT